MNVETGKKSPNRTKTTKKVLRGKAAKPHKSKRRTSKHASAHSAGLIAITMLPVSKLKPSGWNPNRMSDAEQDDYSNEVKRLKRLPKPIVVYARDQVTSSSTANTDGLQRKKPT